QVAKFVIRITGNKVGLVSQLGRQRFFHSSAVGKLIKINLEPIGFEEFAVVGKIIVTLVVRLMIKPFYEKAPPAVAAAEIYGTVHSFHPALLQPVFALIQKFEGRFAIVDAFKEPHTTRGLVVSLVNSFPVHKRSDPAYGLATVVVHDPTYALTL